MVPNHIHRDGGSIGDLPTEEDHDAPNWNRPRPGLCEKFGAKIEELVEDPEVMLAGW